jgi:hypothetical protein
MRQYRGRQAYCFCIAMSEPPTFVSVQPASMFALLPEMMPAWLQVGPIEGSLGVRTAPPLMRAVAFRLERTAGKYCARECETMAVLA